MSYINIKAQWAFIYIIVHPFQKHRKWSFWKSGFWFLTISRSPSNIRLAQKWRTSIDVIFSPAQNDIDVVCSRNLMLLCGLILLVCFLCMALVSLVCFLQLVSTNFSILVSLVPNICNKYKSMVLCHHNSREGRLGVLEYKMDPLLWFTSDFAAILLKLWTFHGFWHL